MQNELITILIECNLPILFDAYLLGSQGLKFEGYIRKQILRYESRDCR